MERKIREVNKLGLKNKKDGTYISFYTPILNVAYQIGQSGISLKDAPIVSGYRYGNIPESGLSYNCIENRYEMGLSMASVNGWEEIGSSIFFCDRKKIEVSGILLPYKGSDGEHLILPTSVENWDEI